MPSLRILTLDYNELTALVPGIFQISSLVNLDVSHNKLHELPDMEDLTLLVSLNLNNNQIEEVRRETHRVKKVVGGGVREG